MKNIIAAVVAVVCIVVGGIAGNFLKSGSGGSSKPASGGHEAAASHESGGESGHGEKDSGHEKKEKKKKEASSHGKSIFEYDAASTGAFDYQNFVEEFLRDHAGARQKKAFYEAHFYQLPAHEKEEIIQFAMQNLSNYNRSRLDYLEEEPILREALLIERNKILEKLFPYREHSTANQRP